MRTFYIILFMGIIGFGCSSKTENSTSPKRLKVVATTGMIYDAVINIAGDSVDAVALMGPGVDPHLYKATQGDLKKLTDADLILYNGLYLEGKMGEVFEQVQRIKPVVAVAAVLPEGVLRANPLYDDAFDPHVWFDVELWQEVVRQIGSKLIEHDSIHRTFYQKNQHAYLHKLDSLDQWVQQEIQTIPEDQRVLITAHDAFGYFGDAYHIEVVGLQGISTLSEFGLKDIADLVNTIVERQVKAVFVETSVSPKAIEAVVTGCQDKGHEVVIGGNLFSDAMGPWNTEEGTYLGMVKSNVNTITKALR